MEHQSVYAIPDNLIILAQEKQTYQKNIED